MQALMLAAGMGRRMEEHVQAYAKCMIEVGGQTLLERAVDAMQLAGIRKLIMVLGWERAKLASYIQRHVRNMEIELVYNDDYASSNNIYSLYLARERLAQDDTLLLESDLIYDKCLLAQVTACPDRDLAVVAKYEAWMNGTVTTLAADRTVQEFIGKQDFRAEDAGRYYKTVNIYKFSREYSNCRYIPALETYLSAYGRDQYYEMVLRELSCRPEGRLKGFVLDGIPWYEIDTMQDWETARAMFTPKPSYKGLTALGMQKGESK